MTVKHTLVSLDMRVFALCSLMELHRCDVTGYILDNSNLQDIHGIVNRKCHNFFKISQPGPTGGGLHGSRFAAKC